PARRQRRARAAYASCGAIAPRGHVRDSGPFVTKALVVDPRAMRARGELRTAPIPLNAYAETIEDERRRLGDDRLRRVLRDMLLVREFETMLDLLKRDGAYRGVTYDHRGPAHL